MILRWLPFLAVYLLVIAAQASADDETEAGLKYLGIKFTRDADQKIVSVELPGSARDYHLEAILDNPKLVPTIAEFKAPGCRASFARVKELENLPALVAVNFDGVKTANDYVACLRGVRTLRTLSIAHSSLTNTGLEDICKSHPSLRHLDISDTKVTIDLAIPMLLDLRELESLQIAQIIRDFNFEHSHPPPGAVEFGRLADLPRLKRIVASGFEITSEQLLPFACNCQLEELSLHTLACDVDTLIYLQECHPQLRFGPKIAAGLRISFTGREHVTSIQNCPYPRFLRMPQGLLTRLEDLEIIAAKKLDFLDWTPALKRLELGGFHMNRHELSRLAKAPNVESLTIRSAKIDGEIVGLLLAIPSLKQFGFRFCEIDATAAAKIREHGANGRIYVSPF